MFWYAILPVHASYHDKKRFKEIYNKKTIIIQKKIGSIVCTVISCQNINYEDGFT